MGSSATLTDPVPGGDVGRRDGDGERRPSRRAAGLPDVLYQRHRGAGADRPESGEEDQDQREVPAASRGRLR